MDDDPRPSPFGTHIRKHYHASGSIILAGHRDSEPWFGTSCPPECPRPDPDMRPMEPFWRDYVR